jgi:hypothetical protein
VLEKRAAAENPLVESNMNLKNLFLLLAIVFLVIGFSSMFVGHGTGSKMAMIEGIGKGCAGVFFILYYIFMLFGNQPTDKTSSH